MVRYLVIQGPKRATIPPDHGGLEARLGKNPLYITVQEVTDGTLASDLRLPSGMCVAETRLEMYLADFGIVPYEDGTFETITRTALVLQEH
ncbi:hypothetical protein HYU15_00080 [Candidatus Woesearchaeota archaeon]|nr:hypothetical protein [Candidatus Woesearchaeota archaeon]